MADKEVLKDLLEDEIKDLYSAEKQLTKAIPKMVKGSNDPALQDEFKKHLRETEAQAQRLERLPGSSKASRAERSASEWKAALRKAQRP